MTEKPWHPSMLAVVASQVAAGLDHMHSKGLIHRDLRPTNIVLDLGLIDTPDDISIHGIVAKVLCCCNTSLHT